MFEIYLSRLRYNYNNFEHIENWNHSHIVIISRFIIQRNITFQSFNRTVDGSFISRSLLTRELKRASKEYPVVGERARPYICNYSFCCRKARCRLSLSVLHGLYTGQRFQTIQFLRAYTYSSSVSFPSNSPTSISLLSRKLWRRLEYIFRFSVVSELRRNENVAAIRKIQSGWPVPFHARNSLSLSLKFLGDFRTFLAWSGHQLGHAQSSTVYLHDYTFPSNSLQISGHRLRECNRNSAWNIDPSARENELFRVS